MSCLPQPKNVKCQGFFNRRSRVGAAENTLLGTSDLTTMIGPSTGRLIASFIISCNTTDFVLFTHIRVTGPALTLWGTICTPMPEGSARVPRNPDTILTTVFLGTRVWPRPSGLS